jgi:hypothetical protein
MCARPVLSADGSPQRWRDDPQGLGLRRKDQSAERLDDLGAARPLAHERRSGPLFAAAALKAAVQYEWQAALCQPLRDTQVAVSHAILEVEDGSGKIGPISDPEALAGTVRSAHMGPGCLQDHLKAACEKWLALNHED